jgi:type II secretory pathway component PulK
MRTVKQDLKKILGNDRGVALMMIMTSIIILMAVYGEFTFDSKISRIKATNILDRSQAKLLAESGLQMAITRLKLYKEAYNKVQSNPTIKQAVPPQLLNSLWEVPFIYPVPVGKNATVIFKETVGKFEKESLLDGSMKVSISNISNRFNLNLLRNNYFTLPANAEDPNRLPFRSSVLNTRDPGVSSEVSVDQSLFFHLRRLVEEKKEKDEGFAERHGNINYQDLVTNLKYYSSDFGSMQMDPMIGEAENSFQRVPLTPKFGPLGSVSELYAIPGWNDEIIELIQNEFSVYPTTQIDLNKITANMLRIMFPFPMLDEPQIQEFFLYRDDPQSPRFFNTIADLKRYFVEMKSWISEADFNTRMERFQQAGISFGSNPNLFKVTAEGSYNRAVFTIVAYVVLPQQENTQQGGQQGGGQPGGQQTGGAQGGGQPGGGQQGGGQQGGGQQGGSDQGAQLLEPRIIEIQIN